MKESYKRPPAESDEPPKNDVERQFVEDLRNVWRRMRSPALDAVASRTKHPEERFQFLVDPEHSAFPTWLDVNTLLNDAEESRKNVSLHWRPRWEKIQGARDGDITSGILTRASAVCTREEFIVHLNDLRVTLNVSYEKIAERTNRQLTRSTAHRMLQPGNFPASADQVRHFVRACGVGKAQANLWVAAWARAQPLPQQILSPPSNQRHNEAQIHEHKRLAERLARQRKYRKAYDHVSLALNLSERLTLNLAEQTLLTLNKRSTYKN
jgi:hypothetical protein